MVSKRAVFAGVGLLLTSAMLLSSCAFFKKTIADLSELDTKSVKTDPAAQEDTASLPQPAETAQPADAPDGASVADPSPQTSVPDVKQAIIGSWSVDHFEDLNGNTVDISDLKSDTAALTAVIAKAFQKGTTVTFTEDGKLKCSVFSVHYNFDSPSTISLSGGILPQSYSGISVTADDTAATIQVGGYRVFFVRK